MTDVSPLARTRTADRARLSAGASHDAIYRMVADALAVVGARGSVLDIGCGTGAIRAYLNDRFTRYTGVDVIRYDGFPDDGHFVQADLDRDDPALDAADVVMAVETIEHLENPRALVRRLVRLARPGGWVVVTTPNQLSALSLLTLMFKQRFSAFQDVHYPTHITALLEVDLCRIAAEAGLEQVRIRYSRQGRVIFTPWHYPRWVSRRWPRLCSDNILMIGRTPAGA